ncbi:class I SAM-dependent methyltransferase [Deminuibacter soli]|uniref:Class I SAM-dependent methyltransferase n=1 Tax=Deminuibacter soli TaxID=2291815 RepID=A0A3E1NEA3_9BACT|nr:class I SAM-dependent methyltransferase [Deminuibacter soli]RFM26303.1 hypothetical protein DXN05_20555 [Deminuibacter soli]
MRSSIRDYSTISPSATGLLLAKGLTHIPYAREAAELIWGKLGYEQMAQKAATPIFLKRLVHFENRYWTVDQLLMESGIKNIFEIGAGYSFRGLAMTEDPSVFYIDSDLPEIIYSKRRIVDEIKATRDLSRDNLVVAAINALDANAMLQQLALLPEGPVVILNEGLLVYLNELEKRKLCVIVHNALMERGGYWITGDIYIKKKGGAPEPDDATAQFLAAHKVEEKKFDSFEAAEVFFNECGFSIAKRLSAAPEKLSSLHLLHTHAYPTQEEGAPQKIRETWMLKCK